MLLELHILQNFAPSNLNRDDTNAPKDCEFGGYRRARISSQCLKRAIRGEFATRELLPEDSLSKRTKTLVDRLVERLTKPGRDPEILRQVTALAINAIGLEVKEGKTAFLLFISEQGIRQFADLIDLNWELLAGLAAVAAAAAAPATKGSSPGGRRPRKAPKTKLAVDCLKSADTLLFDARRAADIALFGRMIAVRADKNVDAASQVAHAISTNRVEMEFDFYTAVDEFAPPDNAGAGMMGTVEFNSSCFYRYANLDFRQLSANLDGDAELTVRAAEAFLRGSVSAIPTGKQNSMAAHNPPSFVLAVLRQAGYWSLANAFLTPVRPEPNVSLVNKSIARLDEYWGNLIGTYGNRGITHVAAISVEPQPLSHLGGSLVVGDATESALERLVGGVRQFMVAHGSAATASGVPA
jgi:CRISPR system Cascade subunit CasC